MLRVSEINAALNHSCSRRVRTSPPPTPKRYCHQDVNTQDCGVYVRCYGDIGIDGRCVDCKTVYRDPNANE